MTTILPTDRPIRYCVTGAGDPITDITQVGDMTGVAQSLSVVANADPLAFVAALPAELFPELPDSGWLEADDIYRYGDGCVIVRQSHQRTHYAPAETPALFIVWREDAADVLEWVAGESVLVGTRRTYDGVTYECIQAHVTQSAWTPPNVPALWALVAPPTAEWAAGVTYTGDNTAGAGKGDVVTYLGLTYRCLQSHTSIATWTPVVVPALWLRL